MKKKLIALMIFSIVFAGLVGMASAAQNCTNTNQKGSLLVFPKIDVRVIPFGDTFIQRDTLVRISNDYPAAIQMSCIWVNSELDHTGFSFTLPANASIFFSAASGRASRRIFNEVASFPLPFQINPYTGELFPATGELKCWAVNPDTGVQISFNHLNGVAEIVDSEEGSLLYGYQAWSFTARCNRGAIVGNPGTLLLSGNNGAYDACPAYLTTEYQPMINDDEDFSPGTEMTLVPCWQDLTQDGLNRVVTKALFEIFDQNGSKAGQAWKCVNTFFDDFLQNIQPGVDPWTGFLVGAFGGQNFAMRGVFTDVENMRLRVSAVKSTVCESPYYYNFWRDMPPAWTAPSGIPGLASAYYFALGMGPTGSSKPTSFLGVIVKHNPDGGMFAHTPCMAGIDQTGRVLYDPGCVIFPESVN